MTAIEISSYFGLAAMTLLTFNILIAVTLRIRWQLRQPPPRVHRPKQSRSALRKALRRD
jgi:hypothetical protein